MSLTKKPINPIIANPIAVAIAIFSNSFLSGFVHLLTSLIESFANCFPGSMNKFSCSIFEFMREDVLLVLNSAAVDYES